MDWATLLLLAIVIVVDIPVFFLARAIGKSSGRREASAYLAVRRGHGDV